MLDTRKLTLLDGAMGTMLQREGLRYGESPELVALTNPELLVRIHRAYIEAGAQIVYANTFGANRRNLAATGHSVAEVVRAAVGCAKAAAEGSGAKVALDIGPLGTLLEPLGDLPFEAAAEMFAEIAVAGAEAGADLAVIETMSDLQEARAALIAVKERTSLPCMVTMSFEESGRSYTGCTVASMAEVLTGLGADAIGFNCSLGPAQMADMVAEARRYTHLPLIAKPNAGLPDPATGAYDLSAEAFAEGLRHCVRAGASLIGGCCGTAPEYIAALRDMAEEPAAIPDEIQSALCTATRYVALEGVRVIGERINPTGKKRFQQALREHDLDYIVTVALQQQDAGAEILDVNVGFPGVDEEEMLPAAVRAIQAACDLPLMLDSTNPAALEAALRVCCGKAAINSVNGDPASQAKILPLARKYGAAVVGLTMNEGGLPKTAQERLSIAQSIREATRAAGIPDRNLWIDCLTLTVSAQQDQAKETLAAVDMVERTMGLHTVLGVSNISFGLPGRPLMTSVFLTAAMRSSLSLAIVNPNQREIMDAIAAWRALSGQDEGCGAYVARFADAAAASAAPLASALTLEEAVRRGLKADAAALAKEALRAESGMEIVERRLIPALDAVGADYESGKAFLPQLLSAAQAAQAVFAVLKEAMASAGEAPVKAGRMLMATVRGDVHDIGKNIVKTVLENYGWEIIDLGKDVPPETIVRAVQEQSIRIVGLSALMTTTLPAMEETVRQLKALENPPFVVVGGAVVTQEYARSIGADAFARDAREAERVIRHSGYGAQAEKHG